MEPVRKKFELPEFKKLKSQAYPDTKKASKFLDLESRCKVKRSRIEMDWNDVFSGEKMKKKNEEEGEEKWEILL